MKWYLSKMSKQFFDIKNVRGDIMGGVTAGIVALPLALAFGEASGAGPIAGLYGAIIVGFFAALFGGTGSQISGPTGPMIVVFAGVLSSLSGDLSLVFLSVILAGLIQILMGVMKFGQFIRLVPYPVISGFMSGIGLIIIALQLPRLFGYSPDGAGTINALLSVPDAITNMNGTALVIALVTVAVVFSWPARLGKYIPGALVALVVGTVISVVVPGSPILGDIPRGLPELQIPSFNADTITIVLEAALLLALLGAIDSLLTSLVADNMTKTRHNSDQELIGQGIGNTVAGFFGGIPGAGATMRTVVNIRSGGGTKISGMTHSLLLLLVAVSLAPLAEKIPTAALAGILVKVGYDIIDFGYLKKLHKSPRWDVVLMLLVLVFTVFVDLITAVGLGIVLAAIGYVKQTADLQLKKVHNDNDHTDDECVVTTQTKGYAAVVSFDGLLSFGASADLAHVMRDKWAQGKQAIIIDFTKVPSVDVSVLMAMEAIADDAHVAEKNLIISGASQQVKTLLHNFDVSKKIPQERWFDTHDEAVVFTLEKYQQYSETKLMPAE